MGVMRRRFLALLCGPLVLPAAASAQGSIEVTSSRAEGETEFSFASVECDAELGFDGEWRDVCPYSDAAVSVGGKRLEVEDDTSPKAIYRWSCERPGKKTWRAMVPYESEANSGNYDAATVRTGTFTVPRCKKSLDRRVTRGTAAGLARDNTGREDEFVSSSRCVATSRVLRGRASRWRCVVTHNDTIRECRTRVLLRFITTRKFGVREKDSTLRRKRLGCTFF